MRFPSADRVVYQRTSLVEVIAQVKFTPVLKIDTEVPAMVQDALRAELPAYERQDVSFVLGGSFPVPVPADFMDRRAEHAFATSDGRSKVTLGRDFVALSVRDYTRWERFQALFARATKVTHDAYGPNGLTRVGLRYQNVVHREALGLGGVPWRELLQPSLLGMFAEEEPWRPAAVSRQEVYGLDAVGGPATARILHGTVASEAGAIAYLIDSDFFVERNVDLAGLDEVLEDLHAQSRGFFRYCVLDRLHVAMQPEAP